VIPEEELEAAVWRALRDCRVTCDQPIELVDAIVAAARAYAAGDGEALAEARRAVLHRESRP